MSEVRPELLSPEPGEPPSPGARTAPARPGVTPAGPGQATTGIAGLNAQVARDIRIIRNWVAFFGVLTILGLVTGIIFGIVIAHEISQNNQNNQNNQNGVNSTSTCDPSNPSYPFC